MKSLNIGVDIDGCVTNPYYYLSHFNKIFNKQITIEQCTEYDLRKIYNITHEEWESKFQDNIEGFLDSVDIRDDVVEVLSRIKLNHDCHFITARSNTEYMRKRTEDYLDENNLNGIPLHMLSSHYKVNKAKELGIHTFIEDCGNNALELAREGIRVFLMDTNYNQCVEHENIIRVKDWREIEQLLMD